MALTEKMRLFAIDYARDPLNQNARESAIRAGYPPAGARTAGPRLLRHPEVKALLETLRPEPDPGSEALRDFVVRGLKAIASGEKTSERDRLQAFKQLAGFLDHNTPPPGPEGPTGAARPRDNADFDDGDDMRAIVAGAVKH